MKKTVHIILGISIVLTGGSATAELDVLVPNLQVSTVHPRIHVVGSTDHPAVAVALNGKHLTTVIPDGDIFHALVNLPYGLNQITVTPLTDVPAGESGSTDMPDSLRSPLADQAVQLDVLCGPSISREYRKLFTANIFHDSGGHPECLDCHGPTIAEEEGGDAEWCFECHPIIRRQFSGHVVGDEKLCINCHRLEPDLSRRITGVYTDMNPCYLCHKDKIGEFAQDFIHGPVAGGTCVVCHNPHGSDFEDNLRSPVPVLCLFCHTSIEEQEDPVQHAPFAEGRCVDCHDPHATGNRWVLNRSSGALCVECHQEVLDSANHRHPIDAKPKTVLNKNLALNDEGRMECLTCHHPHSGNAQFLLRTHGGHECLGCHPEYQ